jgi:hypothetical protein
MIRIYKTPTQGVEPAFVARFNMGGKTIALQYNGHSKSEVKKRFQSYLVGAAKELNKIVCFAACELIFDDHRGIYIYRALYDLAVAYGYGEEWDESENVECGEAALDWLNENICVECRLEWNEGAIWLCRDGFNFETY